MSDKIVVHIEITKEDLDKYCDEDTSFKKVSDERFKELVKWSNSDECKDYIEDSKDDIVNTLINGPEVMFE